MTYRDAVLLKKTCTITSQVTNNIYFQNIVLLITSNLTLFSILTINNLK